MAGREPYETSQALSMSNVRIAYSADGTAMYTPMGPPTPPTYGGGDNSGAAVVNSTGGGEVMKRKRGRPRKYAPDGSMPSSAGLSSPSQPLQAVPGVVQTGGFPSPNSGTAGGGTAALSSGKKARGRPPGSGNKQHQVATSGSAGVGFTPHIIDVKAGEDVLVKLMSFSQNSARMICILSASGSISNVTLRQAATSGGTVTYEGRFEILSLSGSFLLSDLGGQRSRTGGLSISLAGPDGRVLGGGVAGLLTAAAPVQIIVGTFVEAGAKQLKSGKLEGVNAQMKPLSGTSAGGSLSESSGGLGSPIDQSNNGNLQGMASMPWR